MLLNLQHTPTTTTFPYTTLFRSSMSLLQTYQEALQQKGFQADKAQKNAVQALQLLSDELAQFQSQRSSFMKRWLDRKSTRLNSSHVAISYAVFCLKSKNTDH